MDSIKKFTHSGDVRAIVDLIGGDEHLNCVWQQVRGEAICAQFRSGREAHDT